MRLPSWRTFIAAITLAVSAAGCASLDAWQRRQIFQNEQSARWGQNAPPMGTEEYNLPLANGDHVHVWFLPADDAQAPSVLFLHGARHNLNSSAARFERLHALGFSVLAVDYRGFGRSTALLPSEHSALDDARVAFAELARRTPDPAQRFVYGYSLGGALAIALAAERDGLAGVIVESSFTRVADVVRDSRWGWIPFVGLAVTQTFDSLARIERVDEPLLLIHGTADGIVPHTMSDRLLAAAGAAPLKRVIKVEGATHRSAPLVAGAEFDRALREFTQSATQVSAARLASPAGVAGAATGVH
jgi:alpha-beta hydrolase superfamily lysophospholipase